MIVLVNICILGEHELVVCAVDNKYYTFHHLYDTPALTNSCTHWTHTKIRLDSDLNSITGCSNTSTVDSSHRHIVAGVTL